MGELKHFLHEHKLILNEAEPVVCKDVECAMCRQPINKLIDAFYSCNISLIDGGPSRDCVGFFLHKTCSELPSTFTHPMFPQHPLSLISRPYRKLYYYKCYACVGIFQGFMYVSNSECVCLKCVKSELRSLEGRTHDHPGHNHPLTLVQRPTLFLCDACNTTATDLSYICNKCCFCIHKICADAPITYQCKNHNQHTLILAYSLPKEYHEFLLLCNICDKIINPIYWVYYCANCRFFAHLICASLPEMLSLSRDDEADSGESNLMHFPAHDKASLHKMMQQCIMQAAVLHNSAIEQPSPYINHWSHEHQLELGNKLEDTELQICNGCTKPISLVDDIFYECNSCSFFLHRSCAQFPDSIEHQLAGKLVGSKLHELAAFKCRGCNIPCNGILMWNETTWLDIVCASLPTKIKHDAHRHPLIQVKSPDDYFCRGCLFEYKTEKQEAILYGCEKCEFYIHIRCVLLPHLANHRWDEHPLYLILSVKNVPDHPHEFDCEFCSKEIYPNTWFYHCNVCDLSFHTLCIDPYYYYSNIKFGATLIYSASCPHSHGLTWVLNRKKRRCKICGEDVAGLVLECSPCKYIVHHKCFMK